MSEQINRKSEGFSKYDSMSIEELEEILRADAMGPERDDSDVDEILYVMEVLAKKRRENGTAGKTAQEAYQDFQEHYLPQAEAESKRRCSNRALRIITIAASIVLVFTMAISVNAFGLGDVWDAVVNWADETFCFSMGKDVSDPTPDDTLDYQSLQDVLKKGRINVTLPHWIPERYTFSEIIIDQTPKQDTYIAFFTNDTSLLKITIQSYLTGQPEQVEISNDFKEVYTAEGIDYYLFSNHNQAQAVWTIDTYECYISGELSIDEIKLMIDSIEKG